MVMSIIHITEETFDSEVLQAPVPVLVDFWAEWCGPCRMLAPIVEELAQEYVGRLRVVKIDIDEQPKLALVHKVLSIPTVSLYVHGKEVKRLIGLRDKPELAAAIEEALGKV
ncbi:MAG TPA: thioredoxin [Clostridiales bacterium]|nr:thioredoxin [Clostridiales bacterium]